MSACLSCGLVVIRCSECDVVYGISQTIHSRRFSDGGSFYCTNGHAQVFPRGESEADKLRDQLAAKEREIESARRQTQHVQDELASQRYRLTPKQEHERDWLMDHVKGVGWERANALIKAFGRVRVFLGASPAEVNEETAAFVTISESLADVLQQRTREALKLNPIQRLIASQASAGNALPQTTQS